VKRHLEPDSGVGRLALAVAALLAIALAAALFSLSRTDGATAQVPLPVPPPPPGVPPVPPPPPGVPQQYVLKVGDTFRVEDAGIGCQVTRRANRPTIECRRDGRLKGTYGTFLSKRKVTVARFRSPTTAQEILSATHGGRWRACSRTGPRGKLARAAAGSCR
jgi:hypothetical protein